MVMPQIGPFDSHAADYEAWFDLHSAAYASEVAAVRELWPEGARGVEIGAGAGHFTAPLGITYAVEPSAAMRRRAHERGVRTIAGVAEHLPFAAASFDAALMVTTLCFVDDPRTSLLEMSRVLRHRGCAVVGFVDADSALAQEYERRRAKSTFYRDARFFSSSDVTGLLVDAGFDRLAYRQTLFSSPHDMGTPDPVRAGYGEGAFLVIRGHKRAGTPC
jgi:SAM-dependent methyltransferase